MKRNDIKKEMERQLFYSDATTIRRGVAAKGVRRLNIELVRSYMPHPDPATQERAMRTIDNLERAGRPLVRKRPAGPSLPPLRERPERASDILMRADRLLLYHNDIQTRVRPLQEGEEILLRRLNIELVRAWTPHPDPATQERAMRTIDNLQAQLEEEAPCHAA